MAELATNTTIKGDGLRENVRSYMRERTIDFAEIALAVGTNYEIGDLPAGFIPRNVAIVELAKADASATFKVLAKSDSAELTARTIGASTGMTAAFVGDDVRAGETLAIALATAVPTAGVVKVVVSGDLMTDVWDAADGQGEITPASLVTKTVMN